ncbi:MAG TPA: ATP-binding cassette domain-containing protein [Acidobacteriota bacterium]|nr:ATP-binding cassette domain-containing protein [Acidobacteriota bacterium]
MHISLHDIYKQFGDKMAVDGVSFEVQSGRLFGLLGPNGAGKTTLIRMLMDILQPDSGRILYDGRPLDVQLKDRITYLPEERGLYLKQKVRHVIEYFARLKGLSKSDARARMEWYLGKLEMSAAADQKVEELSKGNQQKIQLISVFVSAPDLVILDEPFSGLDPLNVRLCKSLLAEEKERGTTILLSTHQMSQVEELCDDLMMISQGVRVLYGPVREIIHQHSEPAVLITCRPALTNGLEGVERIVDHNSRQKVFLREGVKPSEFLGRLVRQGHEIEDFTRALYSLEEIFVHVAREANLLAAKDRDLAQQARGDLAQQAREVTL